MKKVILGMLMLASMNVFAQDTTSVKKEHKKEHKGDHKHKGSHKGDNKDGEHRKKERTEQVNTEITKNKNKKSIL